jgi:two-component system, cell cycle sensor histidine kinase and response regulator CckA
VPQSGFKQVMVLAAEVRRGAWIIAAVGLILVLPGAFGWAGTATLLVGLTLILTGVALVGVSQFQRHQQRLEHLRMFQLVANDPAALFATDPQGQVILRNMAAESRFGRNAGSILEALSRHAANPAAILLRLQHEASETGAAQADLAGQGGFLRVVVHRSSGQQFLWRIDPFSLDGLPVLPPRTDAAIDGGSADLEDVPVALMTFGPDGLLRSANRAARDLMLQGELRSMMFHDLFEGLGRPVSDWLSDVVSARLPGGTEVLRARKGAEDAFLQVTLHRFVEGGRASALAVLNDATRLKTLEAQFAQSQKMQAIGQLAGGIAHDFNNLLTAISGHCDLLLLRHGHEDPEFADLEQIRQNANRAAALVGQLLAFSRKQTLKPERLDLEDVLADLIHLLDRLVVERVGLQLRHVGRQGAGGAETPLGPVRADRRQLEQVLVNLVINARDAMPDGGQITIETHPLTLTEVLKRDRASVPPGDYAVVRVMDTGVGIPPENLGKIFEPFFTTKRVGEGTGLGLSMAYGIVKQSGGFIFVDSDVGIGTTFTLYLPVTDAEPPSKPAEVDPRRHSIKQGQGVVLLVEDEAPVRAFAGRALRLRGYTVVEAANAEEALKTLEDPSLEVDVFVTDVVMPGLDGPSWVKIALRDRPGVKVIFMSGYAEDALSEDQLRIPNSVFLPKPFSLNDLTSTVQAQFG